MPFRSQHAEPPDLRAGIVAAIIDLIENYVFKTPCVLFGGPLCFFGMVRVSIWAAHTCLRSCSNCSNCSNCSSRHPGLQNIFLSIRCAFRLCGIISALSAPSSLELYDDMMWVTAQIGLGRFKAAEAIEAVR